MRLWVWPRCTFPGCECRRTWRTEAAAASANLRHMKWTRGNDAICYCHGLEAGATFPCDTTDRLVHSV